MRRNFVGTRLPPRSNLAGGASSSAVSTGVKYTCWLPCKSTFAASRRVVDTNSASTAGRQPLYKSLFVAGWRANAIAAFFGVSYGCSRTFGGVAPKRYCVRSRSVSRVCFHACGKNILSAFPQSVDTYPSSSLLVPGVSIYVLFFGLF